jgi:hypothetical protein
MSKSHITLQPCAAEIEAAARRWTAHMLRGDFDSAWRESDFIRASGPPDPHRFWDGEPIDGRRIILRCLHGFGDAVQFLRYAPQLAARARSLVIELPPRMLDLAAFIDGVSQTTTWNDPPRREDWDCQIEVMELPYLFRTELSDLPIARNYLTIPQHHQQDVARRMNSWKRPRVGIVWASGEWNPARSLSFSLVCKLMLSSDCEFWNLQGGCAADEWAVLPPNEKFRDARHLGYGLTALAACIQQIDLIITVDTLAAHLAGAMGKPAWVLLTTPADWRWMANRDDSPWYPSLRLFRQRAAGDWASVLAQVRTELARWLCDTQTNLLISR